MGVVLRSLGMWLSKDQLADVMKKADKDNSGDISYTELVAFLKA